MTMVSAETEIYPGNADLIADYPFVEMKLLTIWLHGMSNVIAVEITEMSVCLLLWDAHDALRTAQFGAVMDRKISVKSATLEPTILIHDQTAAEAIACCPGAEMVSLIPTKSVMLALRIPMLQDHLADPTVFYPLAEILFSIWVKSVMMETKMLMMVAHQLARKSVVTE